MTDRWPYCPGCGKGFAGRDACPYCDRELIEPAPRVDEMILGTLRCDDCGSKIELTPGTTVSGSCECGSSTYTAPVEDDDGVVRDAIREIAREHSKALERELIGAWRAGYGYLHVYNPLPGARGPIEREKFSAATLTIPSHSKTPPRPAGALYAYTYDLTATDRGEVLEYR